MIRTWAPLAFAYVVAAWLYLSLRANAGSVSVSTVVTVPSIESMLEPGSRLRRVLQESSDSVATVHRHNLGHATKRGDSA